jgi:hypothetical protein
MMAPEESSGVQLQGDSSDADRRLRRDDAEFFNALLDAVCTPDGLVVFLHAYFDASERPGGTYCVAGYAFTPQQAKNFVKDWRKMLGPYPYFRMADLWARQGVFKGISKPERDRMIKRAVAIIRERSSVSAIVLCDRHEIETLAPAGKRGLRGPYPACCHFCMALLGKWLDKRSPKTGDIAYFFEAGDQYAGEAGEVMKLAGSRAGIEAGFDKFYRYRSHTFAGKEAAPPLQAADLLAWEWTKLKVGIDQLEDTETLKLRRSLFELMKGNRENFLERHITGVPLQTYFEKMKDYDLLDD